MSIEKMYPEMFRPAAETEKEKEKKRRESDDRAKRGAKLMNGGKVESLARKVFRKKTEPMDILYEEARQEKYARREVEESVLGENIIGNIDLILDEKLDLKGLGFDELDDSKTSVIKRRSIRVAEDIFRNILLNKQTLEEDSFIKTFEEKFKKESDAAGTITLDPKFSPEIARKVYQTFRIILVEQLKFEFQYYRDLNIDFDRMESLIDGIESPHDIEERERARERRNETIEEIKYALLAATIPLQIALTLLAALGGGLAGGMQTQMKFRSGKYMFPKR